MKRLFLLLLFFVFLLSGCNLHLPKPNPGYIILSKEPITEENVNQIQSSGEFLTRQRIYYLLICAKSLTNPNLRLQVVKLDFKYPTYKMEIPYAVDIERGANLHYVSDYFVLNRAGRYFVRIFSHDDFQRPLAETEFEVVDR